AQTETSHAQGQGCDSIFTRTWTATSSCGNTTIVNQSITVKYDSQAPVASGDTTDKTAPCNTPFGDLTFGPVTFNDNCDGAITAQTETSHAQGQGCDSIFTRTWTATDGCGNTTIRTQSITVKYDTEAPVAIGDTTDKTAPCNTPFGELIFGPVSFTDNCSIEGGQQGNPCVASYKGNNGGG